MSPLSDKKKSALNKEDTDKSLESLLSSFDQGHVVKSKVNSMIEQVKSHCSQSMELMKVKLAKEKQKSIKLQSIEPLREREKSDFENLFLDCIEEQKKMVEKRRSLARISAQKRCWKRESTDDELKSKMKSICNSLKQPSELSATDRLQIFERFILHPDVLTAIYNKTFESKSELKLPNALIHPIN